MADHVCMKKDVSTLFCVEHKKVDPVNVKDARASRQMDNTLDFLGDAGVVIAIFEKGL